MLRIVVLGTSSAVPTPQRLPSAIAIKTGDTFLFDCGEGCQRQMMKYRISYAKVNSVFFSHLHADHTLGIFGLIQTMNLHGRTEPLHLYGPKGLKEMVGTVLQLKHLRAGFPVEMTEITADKTVYEDKLVKVSAFKVKHGVEAFGYVLEEQPMNKFYEEKAKGMGIQGKLFREIQEKGFVTVGKKKIKLEDVTFVKPGRKIVYSGDTLPTPATVKAAHGAELLIHESTFANADAAMAKEKFHSTAAQAAEIAKKAGASKLLLTHFSNRYTDAGILLKEAKEVFENTELAEEGKELLI